MIGFTLLQMNWGIQMFLVMLALCAVVLFSMVSYAAMPKVNAWIISLMDARLLKKETARIASASQAQPQVETPPVV